MICFKNRTLIEGGAIHPSIFPLGLRALGDGSLTRARPESEGSTLIDAGIADVKSSDSLNNE